MTVQRGDVAHLGHVELLTPTLAESLSFFEELLGMEREHEVAGSVFLRGYGDYERYSLKLSEAATPGLGHIALRASSPEALDRCVASLERSGLGVGWHEGDHGHGDAYRFTDHDGRAFEIYFASDVYEPPPHLRPALINQPQRRTGRGVGVQRLEHVNLLSPDVGSQRHFLEESLGYRTTEIIVKPDGKEYGAWLTATIQGHEIIYIEERLPTKGRLHHLAFWVETREDVLGAADLFQDHGVFIEAGPAKHTPVQAFYLYVYEPGGNRVEVTSGGQLVFDPTPRPTIWTDAVYQDSRAWGKRFPSSFDTYGTPPVADAPERTTAAGAGG